MKIENIELYKSITIETKEIFFDEKKEILFLGRSNAGKSSLLNILFNKKNFVKTSSKPGSTRTVNLFTVNNKFYFTDLPGYWFAKMWIIARDKIDALISWYVEERKPNIKKAFIIIDSKLWAQKRDLDMYLYLKNLNIPLVIINNKVDKLSKNEALKSIDSAYQIFFWEKILNFSTITKEWFKEFEAIIDESFKK